MITLKPPFRAENMEGLYNKVIKGQLAKIPDKFSPDLAEIVKLLIQVAPDARPSCGKNQTFNILLTDQILKHPIVQKRIEYFKNYTDEHEDQALLQTIRIPKNLLFLSDKLPQANYEKNNNRKNHSFTKKGSNDLPDIRVANIQTKKTKQKENLDESVSEGPIPSASGKKVSRSVSGHKEKEREKSRQVNNANKLDTIEESTKANKQQRNKSPTNRQEAINYPSENNMANIVQLHINSVQSVQQKPGSKNSDLPQLRPRRNEK